MSQHATGSIFIDHHLEDIAHAAQDAALISNGRRASVPLESRTSGPGPLSVCVTFSETRGCAVLPRPWTDERGREGRDGT